MAVQQAAEDYESPALSACGLSRRQARRASYESARQAAHAATPFAAGARRRVQLRLPQQQEINTGSTYNSAKGRENE